MQNKTANGSAKRNKKELRDEVPMPVAYGSLVATEAKTLAGRTYERLREDIVAGKLALNIFSWALVTDFWLIIRGTG